jgi:DMSO reductase family type II enzyme heme b subunit
VRIQFPTAATEGGRPYFLLGDKRLSVNLWQWKASDNLGSEFIAAGAENVTQQEKQDVKVIASFSDGRYKIVFRRLLNTGNEKHTVFEIGKFMPFSVTLFDGRDHEENNKGAISAWYYMILEPPTPAKVYIFPPIAFLIALGFGVLLNKKLPKKDREDDRRHV